MSSWSRAGLYHRAASPTAETQTPLPADSLAPSRPTPEPTLTGTRPHHGIELLNQAQATLAEDRRAGTQELQKLLDEHPDPLVYRGASIVLEHLNPDTYGINREENYGSQKGTIENLRSLGDRVESQGEYAATLPKDWLNVWAEGTMPDGAVSQTLRVIHKCREVGGRRPEGVAERCLDFLNSKVESGHLKLEGDTPLEQRFNNGWPAVENGVIGSVPSHPRPQLSPQAWGQVDVIWNELARDGSDTLEQLSVELLPEVVHGLVSRGLDPAESGGIRKLNGVTAAALQNENVKAALEPHRESMADLSGQARTQGWPGHYSETWTHYHNLVKLFPETATEELIQNQLMPMLDVAPFEASQAFAAAWEARPELVAPSVEGLVACRDRELYGGRSALMTNALESGHQLNRGQVRWLASFLQFPSTLNKASHNGARAWAMKCLEKADPALVDELRLPDPEGHPKPLRESVLKHMLAAADEGHGSHYMDPEDQGGAFLREFLLHGQEELQKQLAHRVNSERGKPIEEMSGGARMALGLLLPDSEGKDYDWKLREMVEPALPTRHPHYSINQMLDSYRHRDLEKSIGDFDGSREQLVELLNYAGTGAKTHRHFGAIAEAASLKLPAQPGWADELLTKLDPLPEPKELTPEQAVDLATVTILADEDRTTTERLRQLVTPHRFKRAEGLAAEALSRVRQNYVGELLEEQAYDDSNLRDSVVAVGRVLKWTESEPSKVKSELRARSMELWQQKVAEAREPWVLGLLEEFPQPHIAFHQFSQLLDAVPPEHSLNDAWGSLQELRRVMDAPIWKTYPVLKDVEAMVARGVDRPEAVEKALLGKPLGFSGPDFDLEDIEFRVREDSIQIGSFELEISQDW